MVTMFVGRIQKEKTDPEPISSSPRMLSYYMANGSLPYIKLGPRVTQVLVAGEASPNEKQKQSFLEKVASLRYEQPHMADQPNGKVH